MLIVHSNFKILKKKSHAQVEIYYKIKNHEIESKYSTRL